MTTADFGRFYKAIHGYDPFPWQERLLEQVSREGWPRTISLPTSSGKTSAIDVAVFHLALESEKNLERKAALRIFFVIDRRVVVDEAAEHALKLAQALLDSNEDIVVSVAEALRKFEAKYPLDVAVLRGGMYLDSTWADEPNQPLVCVSTVDQVGSRLLFRGYQVSDEARPVHAGLVGSDSLIIVDEAHLSTPFLDTLQAVEKQQGSSSREARLARGIEVVKMSATVQGDGAPFSLEAADYENHELGKRLDASKHVELRAPEKRFEEELAIAAKELAALPDVYVVGVVVNTVASARAVFEDLDKFGDAVLLTGRNRPYDSKRLWDEFKDRIAAKPCRKSIATLFVVATQTVEVGANLDFDALVTEAAPLDSLRQRFGRLNRLGDRKEARAVIVLRPKEDFVYGAPTATTWEFLKRQDKVDFGVKAMGELLENQDLKALNTTGSEGPMVFGKYFEMWSQTNPAPWPDPDVAPFLHGRKALESADVQVVWRQDLEEGANVKDWREAVELAPPVAIEALALPLGVLRRWLSGEKKQPVADIEGLPNEEEEKRKQPQKPVLIWRGPGEEVSRHVRPGDVVVVPASYGGCDRFGWHPELEAAVEDIGDAANNQMAEKGLRKYRIRLDLYSKTLEHHAEEFRSLLHRLRDDAEEDPEIDIRERLAKLLPSYPGNPVIDSTARVATWPKSKPRPKLVETDKAEDNEDTSAGLDKKITLTKHTAGVVELVCKYASRCGLHEDIVKDLVLSAEAHDLGKWDERFQAWLCRGSLALAMKEKEPLAKSGGRQTLVERRRAREFAGYPQNARHEAASVLLACASGALAHATDRDLVLHLIGTHHGYGRPLMPYWEEDERTMVTAEWRMKGIETGTGRELGRLESGWVERFARLNTKYGYWPLAYMETILRRADCMQSRKEQESD